MIVIMMMMGKDELALCPYLGIQEITLPLYCIHLTCCTALIDITFDVCIFTTIKAKCTTLLPNKLDRVTTKTNKFEVIVIRKKRKLCYCIVIAVCG